MSQAEKPLFTIIIPTYNHGKFIARAINSVIAQSFSDWEVIVINDGSTDNTQEIVDGYCLTDKRILSIVKTNGGTASAINLGIEKARGAWICWLSSDDWYEPDKLEIHKRYIDQYPGCEFFFSHFHMFNDYDGTTVDRDLFGPLPERELQIPALFYRNYVMGVGICASRSLWERAGRMDATLHYAQDYDMWLKMLTISPGYFISERTFTYRHHPGQGSETFQLACLFDASKAAIRYVNEHTFKDFFPLLDLNTYEASMKAVKKILEVSSDPSSYVYSLGFHPGLIMRLLEWIYHFSNREHRADLIAVVKSFSKKTYNKYRGTEFGGMWEETMEIVKNPVDGFSYQPISHVDVGINHYFQCMYVDNSLAAPLKKYLESYEEVRIDGNSENKFLVENRFMRSATRRRKPRFVSKMKNLAKKILRLVKD
jgi:glycosyltransferase involved in cell wall biosynthesis